MNAPTITTAGANEIADERLDQHARADHLRDEVDEQHGERAERRGHARGPLAQPEREDVGERVLARVAHPLGEEQQHRQEGDERRHEAHERVDAEEEHEPGEAEERGGRHVVARDRPAVLQAADRAAGGPELGGGRRPLGRPLGDAERAREDDRRRSASGSALTPAAKTRVIARSSRSWPRPRARCRASAVAGAAPSSSSRVKRAPARSRTRSSIGPNTRSALRR